MPYHPSVYNPKFAKDAFNTIIIYTHKLFKPHIFEIRLLKYKLGHTILRKLKNKFKNSADEGQLGIDATEFNPLEKQNLHRTTFSLFYFFPPLRSLLLYMNEALKTKTQFTLICRLALIS